MVRCIRRLHSAILVANMPQLGLPHISLALCDKVSAERIAQRCMWYRVGRRAGEAGCVLHWLTYTY